MLQPHTSCLYGPDNIYKEISENCYENSLNMQKKWKENFSFVWFSISATILLNKKPCQVQLAP